MGCGNCKASELSLIPTLSRELFRELLALHQSDTSHDYNSYDFACIKNTTRDGGSTALHTVYITYTADTVYTVFTLYTIQTAFH